MKDQAYDRDFFEEAYEQLEIAEQALLSYEETSSLSFIEEGYRALHTFKGAVYMFDYQLIGDFAHEVETIFDLVFHHSITQISNQLKEIYSFIDHLKVLLSNDSKNMDAQLKAIHTEMMFRVEEVEQLIESKVKLKEGNDLAVEEEQEGGTFLMSIQAVIDIAEGEFHPVFNILEDLEEEGEIHKIEYFKENDQAEKLHDTWLLCIHTALDLEALKAYFIFIDDEVTVSCDKVSQDNLLEVTEVTDYLAQLEGKEVAIDYPTVVIDLTKIDQARFQNTTLQKTKDLLSDLSVRVTYAKIDGFIGIISELVTAQSALTLGVAQQGNEELKEVADLISRQVDQLRDIALNLSLIPIKNMLNGLRRMVRDTADELNKEIIFHIEGADVELDKVIIELLNDALMHVLKNCIDHGIEDAKSRLQKGKSEAGNIYFKAYQRGSNVYIDIKDDGKGLDEVAILEKALAKNLVTAAEASRLKKEEIYQFIFSGGFSTAASISNVSGRGIGMSVVQKNMQTLNGDISIQSERDKGTTFTFKLPLTLSIVDTMLVTIGQIDFLLPLSDLKYCYELQKDEVQYGDADEVFIGNRYVPLLDLYQEFDLPKITQEYLSFVLLSFGGQEMAIPVDEVVGEYSALLKPLDQFYQHHEFVSNTTILDNGRVGLYLSVEQLFKYKFSASVTA